MSGRLFRLAGAALAPLLVILPQLAAADDFGQVQPKTPDAFTSSFFTLLTKYGTPLGGAILLLSMLLIGVRIMLSAINPRQKAEAMEALLYVIIGGIVLGGALFFAGLAVGIGQQFR
ncbi:MAG: hypothetical protein H5T97_12400 [Firmicutes bacterium]|nr:hypothetical protein [Bacillota bacterium]